MAEELDRVISKIQDYINRIIQDVITIRAKHVDASNKIISKMKEMMDYMMDKYRYVTKKLYDYVSVVETDFATLSETYAPNIYLQYTGPKMALTYDTETIYVPQVDVFVFEPLPGPKVLGELTAENVSNFILFRVTKKTTYTLVGYTFEDIHSRYVRLKCIEARGGTPFIESAEFTSPKYITLYGAVFAVKGYEMTTEYELQAKITKEDHYAYAKIRVGRWKIEKDTLTVWLDGGYVYLETNFPDNASWIIYGFDVGKGVYHSERNVWYLLVDIYYVAGRPILIVQT